MTDVAFPLERPPFDEQKAALSLCRFATTTDRHAFRRNCGICVFAGTHRAAGR
jgi:hypothetical protein